MDSWRGLCALAVALFHFPLAGVVREIPLIQHAYLFVDFFFVLSGFVIATAYENRGGGQETWRFLLRRFGRLWPLHAAMLALFVAAAVVTGDINADARHSALAIVTNLLLVHGLGFHPDLTWNGPSWSISVEAFLYLVFAFLAQARSRLIIYPLIVLAALMVLASWAPHGMASTTDFGVYRGLAGFFTGALVARLPAHRWLGFVELAAMIGVALFVSAGRLTILAPLVFGAAVYVFAWSKGGISAFLRTAPLPKLGEWSYSIYMVHAAVGAVIFAAAPLLGLRPLADNRLVADSTARELAICLGYLAVIVTASALTFRLIERPARDYFNALGSRRSFAA